MAAVILSIFWAGWHIPLYSFAIGLNTQSVVRTPFRTVSPGTS
jgi:hypothetical protein